MGFAWNDLQGFADLIVVDEKYRKKGIGGELLTRCLHALGDRNISLYCAHDMHTFYQKYGFKTGENPCYVYFTSFRSNKDAFKEGEHIFVNHREK